MLIEVTQEDIDNGRRHYCDQCPVALALLRSGVDFGYVVGSHVGLSSGQEVRLPAEVTRFAIRYDAGQPVEPLNFELDDYGIQRR